MPEFLRLSALIHGVPKIGKSRLAATAPGPVCILDPEGGARFLGITIPGWEGRPITYWDPMSSPPPTTRDDGTPLGVTDLVIVRVLNWATAKVVQDWIMSGQHVFKSFVVDTVTELQEQAKHSISSTSFNDQRQWGELKDLGLLIARQWRDFLDHPTNPLFAVIVLAHSDERNGMLRPMLEGALAKRIGGFYDVIGHMRPGYREDGSLGRELVVAPFPGVESGDRTGLLAASYPGGIIRDPNITTILKQINGEAV